MTTHIYPRHSLGLRGTGVLSPVPTTAPVLGCLKARTIVYDPDRRLLTGMLQGGVHAQGEHVARGRAAGETEGGRLVPVVCVMGSNAGSPDVLPPGQPSDQS